MIYIKMAREWGKHTPHARLKYIILILTSLATVIGIISAIVNSPNFVIITGALIVFILPVIITYGLLLFIQGYNK